MQKNLFRNIGTSQKINKPLLFHKNLTNYNNEVVLRGDRMEHLYRTAKKKQQEILESVYDSYAKKNVSNGLLYKLRKERDQFFSGKENDEDKYDNMIGNRNVYLGVIRSPELKSTKKDQEIIYPKKIKVKKEEPVSVLNELRMKFKNQKRRNKSEVDEFYFNYKNNPRFREIYRSIDKSVKKDYYFDCFKPSYFRIRCNYFDSK